MTITYTFTGSKDSNGYGYFAFIKDGQLVIGESWPHEGGIIYTGDYLGAAGYLATLKQKDPKLYEDIEKCFSKHDPNTVLYGRSKSTTAGELKPGDKFKRNKTEYLLVDLIPSECFLSQPFSNFVFALNLSNYKVVGLEKTWEVELIK